MHRLRRRAGADLRDRWVLSGAAASAVGALCALVVVALTGESQTLAPRVAPPTSAPPAAETWPTTPDNPTGRTPDPSGQDDTGVRASGAEEALEPDAGDEPSTVSLFAWTEERIAGVGPDAVQERLDQCGAERGTYQLLCEQYPCIVRYKRGAESFAFHDCSLGPSVGNLAKASRPADADHLDHPAEWTAHLAVWNEPAGTLQTLSIFQRASAPTPP